MFTFKREKRESQTKRILTALRKKPLTNVDLINMHIFSYSRRLADLREEGHTIVTDRVWIDGRATNTFQYKLMEEEV